MMSYDYPHPVSRTYQYKKITKPLLERKRRARINACLDELKDLMMDALETEGENINKLEKADILELTVRHLQRLQAVKPSGLSTTGKSTTVNDEASAESRWQSGFGHCAAEACRFLSALPGEAAERLARHLAAGLQMNRQISSSPKPSLLSPTLANLEQTASIVSPSPASTTTDRNSPGCTRSSVKRITPYPERNSEDTNDSTASATSPLRTVSARDDDRVKILNEPSGNKDNSEPSAKDKTELPRKPEADDDEEIDVEALDDGDPMWRPW